MKRNIPFIALQLLTTNHVLATELDQTSGISANQNFQQEAYHKASNSGAGDRFGNVMAMSGNTIVVGSPYEASNAQGINGNGDNELAPDSGAAYVYEKIDGVWELQAFIKSSNSEAEDVFAGDVAIEGDTIVIGAPLEDSSATGVNGNQNDNLSPNSGAAYVFTRKNNVWSQQAYLKASNTGDEDYFGSSVGISGDTIVVGARQEKSNAVGVNGNQNNNSFQRAGAAYVFTQENGVWSHQAYLKASNTGNLDHFGVAVAISGNTVLVGAEIEASNATGVNGNQADDSAYASGAAYVFSRSEGVWQQTTYLKASNTEFGDFFGQSLDISNDWIAISAKNEDSDAIGINGDPHNNRAISAGAVFIFYRTVTDEWQYHSYIKASNAGAEDHFGSSVSINNNMLLVGARGESSNATGFNGNQSNNSISFSGAAYAFQLNNNSWNQLDYIKSSNTGEFDLFGYSVAISNEMMVIGANEESSNSSGVYADQDNDLASEAGAIYVYKPTVIFENGFD